MSYKMEGRWNRKQNDLLSIELSDPVQSNHTFLIVPFPNMLSLERQFAGNLLALGVAESLTFLSARLDGFAPISLRRRRCSHDLLLVAYPGGGIQRRQVVMQTRLGKAM